MGKTVVKVLALLALVGLEIGSIDLFVNAYPLPSRKSRQGIANPDRRGCACHCETDTAVFRIWQQRDGPPDRFAANTIGRWFSRLMTSGCRGEAFSKTELLILLGRAKKGTWTVESRQSDGEGGIYIDLVLTTSEGKRKVFGVTKGLEAFVQSPPEPEGELRQLRVLRKHLGVRVMRRLGQLAKSGQWDAGLLVPVDLPLLSKPPALVFREEGKPADEGYRWSLNVKAKNGQLVRIIRGKAFPGIGYFRAATCFGGVADEANAEIWWILVKTAVGDGCGASWYSIRLVHRPPTQQ